MSYTRMSNPIPHRFESLKQLYIPPISSHIDHPILFYSILLIFLQLYSLSTLTNLSIGVSVGRPRPSHHCSLVSCLNRTQRFQDSSYQDVFSKIEQATIKCIHVTNHQEAKDNMVWHFEKNGKCTMRLGYRTLKQRLPNLQGLPSSSSTKPFQQKSNIIIWWQR